MILNPFFLTLFLFLGAAASCEDWRKQRVSNRWILLGLGACAFGYGYLLLNSLLGHWKLRFLFLGEVYLPFSFYPLLLLHAALVTAAALFAWWIRVWPAGDAKLYIVLGLLIVLVDQNIFGFPWVLFLKMLVNIFVPAGIWILLMLTAAGVRALPRLRPAGVRRELTAFCEEALVRVMEIWPYRQALAFYLTHVFALFVGLQLINHRLAAFEVFRTGTGPLILLFFLYFVWGPISRLLRQRGFVAVWAILIVLLWLDPEVQANGLGPVLQSVLRNMVLFGFIFMTFRSTIALILRRQSESRVDMKELRPGMVLSDQAWGALRRFSASSDQPAPRRYADGLFSDDLEPLRNLADMPNLVMTVYRSSPFAFWVFLGSLLSLAIRKNVMFWLIRLWGDRPGVLEAARGAWGL
ncbi:MAG: hypothetical protein A2X36_10695 [Elusimicrobia bacterium GWA2_69_24]|nr:MAG: hypothetical protein A2X36_10695 [Elusimicrobia bacterium GWA2_69_24]HBL18505.1 hypothetical protein [Elusimicrobiota bacterium]